MATGNVLSICNRALLSIGSRSQISSLTEGSVEANACNTLFTPTYEALARTAYWNCLRQQVALSLLAAAQGTPENPSGTILPLPASPWLYSYQVPSNSLQIRALIPTPIGPSGVTVPISPALVPAEIWLAGQVVPFMVAYATDSNNNPLQIILTNLSQAQGIYTVNQPNPQLWDSLFQAAMVASLAAYLVPALSLDKGLMQLQIGLATKIIEQARIRDGDEGTVSSDHIPDWQRVRNSGTIINYGYSGVNGGWTDMCWGFV